MQFDYNSDYATLPPTTPPDFPPADPHPCARITTRIYHPTTGQITTVQNVLVRTLLPKRTAASGTTGDMDYSSSSSEEDDDDDESYMSGDMEGEQIDATDTAGTRNAGEVERAYWIQRTIREAIYGRVLCAVVLKKERFREAEWVVTTEQCAVKEMSWQHIRKERDRLAEDPIKEVSCMQYLKRWYEATSSLHSSSAVTTPTLATENSFEAMAATNIMMPMDLLSDDRHLYSVMPFCDGGELFDRLDSEQKFNESEARYWMLQVLNGLDGLQRAGICHRDMSLENLLVHKNAVCLVIDMGMCLRVPVQETALEISTSMNKMSLSSGLTEIGGGQFPTDGRKSPRHLLTPQGTCGKWIYMSPEIYKNSDPFDGYAVDVWAAGVILFLMLTGFPPWERACTTDERFKYMTAGYLVQMLTEWELGLSSDAMDLLQRMLWADPKDRLSLSQVRAHPWMQGPASPPNS